MTLAGSAPLPVALVRPSLFYVADLSPAVLCAALAAGVPSPERVLEWGLEQGQSDAVREWLSSGGVAGHAPTIDTVPADLDVGDTLGMLMSGGVESARGVVVLLVGSSRARAAAQLERVAEAEGIQMRVLPEGTDLRREAVRAELWHLYELTRRLRRECPWDRKQTQESIVAYTLEETYELVDTIRERGSAGGDAAVRSELGDLLFQVYFIACVAEEEGLYDLGEVAAGIHRKLVRRHPHIFADASAETSEDVKRTWDTIKRESEGREGIFHDVPSAFPATLLAQKLQQRAAAVGFDWDQAHEVLFKLKEETSEIERELESGGGADRVAAEMGDLLFSVVNLARKLKVDPELALRESALRFRERVEEAARIAESRGLVFEDLALEEQETYYQHAKEGLKQ